MAKQVNLYVAKTNLSALVDEVADGGEVIIAKNGKPKARLVPLEPPARKERQLGLWKGKVWYGPDWDAPLPDDIIELMETGDDELFGPVPEDPPAK